MYIYNYLDIWRAARNVKNPPAHNYAVVAATLTPLEPWRLHMHFYVGECCCRAVGSEDTKHITVEAVDLSYLDQPDLDWSDFLFNLISMCIVYAYFSKAAASSESITAVLLCMAVASFDILLLVMRWLWYVQFFFVCSVDLLVTSPPFFTIFFNDVVDLLITLPPINYVFYCGNECV